MENVNVRRLDFESRERLRLKACALYSEGLSYRQIAKKLCVSTSTAHSWTRASVEMSSYPTSQGGRLSEAGGLNDEFSASDSGFFRMSAVWKYLTFGNAVGLSLVGVFVFFLTKQTSEFYESQGLEHPLILAVSIEVFILYLAVGLKRKGVVMLLSALLLLVGFGMTATALVGQELIRREVILNEERESAWLKEVESLKEKHQLESKRIQVGHDSMKRQIATQRDMLQSQLDRVDGLLNSVALAYERAYARSERGNVRFDSARMRSLQEDRVRIESALVELNTKEASLRGLSPAPVLPDRPVPVRIDLDWEVLSSQCLYLIFLFGNVFLIHSFIRPSESTVLRSKMPSVFDPEAQNEGSLSRPIVNKKRSYDRECERGTERRAVTLWDGACA